MQSDYLHKILNNTATDAEKQEFFKALEADSYAQEEYSRYKNLQVLSSLNPEQYRTQQQQSFASFWHKVHPGTSAKAINLWFRYAAIFIIASTMGFMINYLQRQSFSGNQFIEYSSEKGSVSKVRLNDGSAIWLSSGTKLSLNKNSNGETVAHLDGEALFDLVHDPHRKFVVDLGKFKVRDIGTRFNIRAYESEPTISTTLMEGQIDLITTDGKAITSIKPGETAGYDKTSNQMSVQQQDPTMVTAWKDGKFVFIDQKLSDICKELENWYNVEIQIDDPKLADTRYTSVVKRSTTVQMVLKILAITDQIQYEITDKKEGKDFIRILKK